MINSGLLEITNFGMSCFAVEEYLRSYKVKSQNNNLVVFSVRAFGRHLLMPKSMFQKACKECAKVLISEDKALRESNRRKHIHSNTYLRR